MTEDVFIQKDLDGRYAVLGRFLYEYSRRVYGVYKTLALAEWRVSQIYWSRRPRRDR